MLTISVKTDFHLLSNTFLTLDTYDLRTLVTVLCEIGYLFGYLALNLSATARALVPCLLYLAYSKRSSNLSAVAN